MLMYLLDIIAHWNNHTELVDNKLRHNMTDQPEHSLDLCIQVMEVVAESFSISENK